MKIKCRRFFQARRSSGLTLIEVLAATILLSTMLVGMLTMFNRHQKQLVSGDRLRQGVDALETVLSTWYSDGTKLPKLDSMPLLGNCLHHPNFIWHSSVLQVSDSIPDSYIVRVSVFERSDTQQPITFCDLLFTNE